MLIHDQVLAQTVLNLNWPMSLLCDGTGISTKYCHAYTPQAM